MKAHAWSYSSLNDYQNCPRAFQLKRVTKEFKFVESAEMKAGNVAHKHLEDRVNLKTPLPDCLSWLEAVIQKFEGSGGDVVAEREIALDKGLVACGWFDKEVWLRAKLDLTIRRPGVSIICDYKTGKRKPDSDQLMLFAAVEFAMQPEVGTIKSGYLWTKFKKLDSETFERKDIPRIWGHFMPKVERIETAYAKDEWPCRPSGLCGWCQATKAQCKHAKA